MATVLRWILLADDRASNAFDRFSAANDKATAASDRNGKALDRNAKSAAVAEQLQAKLGKTVAGVPVVYDRATTSVDRNEKVLRKHAAATKASGNAFVDLFHHVTGTGDAFAVFSKKTNLFLKIIAGVGAATGVAEAAVSALTITTLGLSSALIVGAAGLAAYGLAVLPAVKQVQNLDKLQQQAATGSVTAAKKYKQALAQASPAVLGFRNAFDSAKKSYDAWAKSLQGPALTPLTRALGLVKPLLTAISPLVRQTSLALNVVIGQLAQALGSGGFTRWVQSVKQYVFPILVNLFDAIGNIVRGLGGIVKAFVPVGTTLTGGLERITKRFADWASTLTHHSGFKALFDQWQKNWPEVRHGLGLLVGILANIVKSMAAMATPGNSRSLWQVANPLLTLALALSSHPALVQALLYIILIGQGANKIKPVFEAMKSGWGALTKVISLLTGGKVQLGMQSAGDTMLLASKNMQKAADTMAGAGAGVREGGAATAAGGAETAAGRGGRLRGTVARIAGLAGAVLLIPIAGDILGGALPTAPRGTLSRVPGWQQGLGATVTGGRQNFANISAAGGGGIFGSILPNITGITRYLHSAWNTAYQTFMRDYGSPLAGFFRRVPGYISKLPGLLTGWFRSTAISDAISRFEGQMRHGIANAFDGARHEAAHIWDQMWDNTAGRAIRGVQDLQKLLRGWAHDIAARFDSIRHDTAHRWDQAWDNTIGRAIQGVQAVQKLLAGWGHWVADRFDRIRHWTAATWDATWDNTVGRLIRGVHTVQGWIDNLRHGIANRFDIIRHQLASTWDTIWNNTVGRVKQGVKAVGNEIYKLRGLFAGPITWVVNHVLNPFIGGVDWIASHVGLGTSKKPLIPKIPGFAQGGRIPGYGGGDHLPALLEPGETVVDKARSRQYAGVFRAMGVKGYQHGGVIGNKAPGRFAGVDVPGPGSAPFGGGILHKAGLIAGIISAIISGNSRALTGDISGLIGHGAGGAGADVAKILTAIPAKLVSGAVHYLIAHAKALFGSAPEIVKYAASWLGRVPYVWGGTAVPGGADCSGFVQTIYKRFGYIRAPHVRGAGRVGPPRPRRSPAGWRSTTPRPAAPTPATSPSSPTAGRSSPRAAASARS